MNIIIIILKGILLYSTIIYWMIIISACDSLMNNSVTVLIIAFIIGVGLIFLCKITISEKDLQILSFNKLIKNNNF